MIFSGESGLDLAILIDRSLAKDAGRWRWVLYYLRNFVNNLGISPTAEGTRVGLIGFDGSASVVLTFNQLRNDQINAAEVLRYINGIRFQAGYRNPVNALRLARTRLFTVSGGARIGSRRVSF